MLAAAGSRGTAELHAGPAADVPLQGGGASRCTPGRGRQLWCSSPCILVRTAGDSVARYPCHCAPRDAACQTEQLSDRPSVRHCAPDLAWVSRGCTVGASAVTHPAACSLGGRAAS